MDSFKSLCLGVKWLWELKSVFCFSKLIQQALIQRVIADMQIKFQQVMPLYSPMGKIPLSVNVSVGNTLRFSLRAQRATAVQQLPFAKNCAVNSET